MKKTFYIPISHSFIYQQRVKVNQALNPKKEMKQSPTHTHRHTHTHTCTHAHNVERQSNDIFTISLPEYSDPNSQRKLE